MAKILVLNGPNLNLLGSREPDIYGATTLDDIVQQMSSVAKAAGHQLSAIQSNAEHELIEAAHQAAQDGVDYIIINPAALTHTSVALRDAMLGVKIPFIELHISNVYQREEFRHKSFFSDIAEGLICGLGVQGYHLALSAAIHFIDHK